MSDFDREAEREKLRKKYERDKQKREASERMSELLLQGATMTNRHCPECHSPVFRYEGRQFCPTCETEITEEDQQGTKEKRADAETAESETVESEAAEASAEKATSESETTAGSEAPTEPTVESEQSSPRADQRDSTEIADDAPTPAEDRRPARVQPPARRETEPTREDGHERRRDAGSGEFRNAEASLKREIEALTRQAEETRDVGRKRDLLAAAREAAETLQVVRQL